MTGTEMAETTMAGATGSTFRMLPRRGWTGTVMLAGWLGVAAGFVAGLARSSDPVEWLYGVEARRDAHARVLRQRNETRPVRAPSTIVATAMPEW